MKTAANRRQRRQLKKLARKVNATGHPDSARLDGLLRQAVAIHKAGQIEKALSLYRQVLSASPRQVDALNLAGTANLQRGRIAEALDMLRAATAIDPNYAEAHNNLGNAFHACGRNEDAAAAYGRAVELKADYAEAFFNLGIARQAAGKIAGAAAAFRRAIQIKPEFVEAHNSLGQVLQEFGDLDEATACCRRAIEIRPNYAPAYNNLGIALSVAGKTEEAMRALECALRIDPAYGRAHFNRGQLLYNAADTRPAVEAFEEALQCDPTLALAQFYLGMIRDQQGDAQAAATHFARLSMLSRVNRYLQESWAYAKSHAGPSSQFHSNAFETLRFAADQARVDGMVLEFGVRHGNSVNFLARILDQEIHGFDSFQGLPESWESFEVGAYTTDGKVPAVRSNVHLHVGWFSDTLPLFAASHPGPVRLMNVDCDIYRSTKTIFEHLADRIVAGTIIVFDEYLLNPQWREDEFKAFQEEVFEHGWRYEYIAFNMFTKQAVVRIIQ